MLLDISVSPKNLTNIILIKLINFVHFLSLQWFLPNQISDITLLYVNFYSYMYIWLVKNATRDI
jgi:hypothetical protein